MNAVNLEMTKELSRIWMDAMDDLAVWTVVVNCTGQRAFSAAMGHWRSGPPRNRIWRGARMPLDDALRLESCLAARVLITEDAIEGHPAFTEKRNPKYNGR